MAKFVPDAILDEQAAIYATATILHVCSTQPANYAGIAALSLASVVLTPGIGNGDFTASNGDTSGRKVTVAAQNAVDVTASGTAGHIVLAISGSSKLLHITTCTGQSLTSGNTVNVPAYDIEMADVTP